MPAKEKPFSLQQLADVKHIPLARLQEFGVGSKGTWVNIPYYQRDGTLHRLRYRTALKAKDGSSWGKGNGLIPYGRWLLTKWTEPYLYLVEGETDAWALWVNGQPCIGIPGASNAGCLDLVDVEGRRELYVVREPGQSGDTFLKGIVARLGKIGFTGTARELLTPRECKDPSDLWIAHPKDFLLEMNRASITAKQIFPVAAPPPPPTADKPTNGKPAAPAAPGATQPRHPPASIEAYYEAGRGKYFTLNGKGHWQPFTGDEMARMLKNRGYSAKVWEGDRVSEVDRYLYEIAFWKSVDFAGELAGWSVGNHDIGPLDCLITRGRKRVEPVKGNWPLLERFLETLLPDGQLDYFVSWLQGALVALDKGAPFRPGQLVAFAGAADSGKSFVQLLITQFLGGRQGDPTKFLLGTSEFTGDFLKCEHLLIEDKALKDFSSARRRQFTANLKSLAVNQEQRVEPKHKDAVLVPVGTRISLSCNLTADAVAILPALEDDVADKVIYFKCGTGELPGRADKSIDWKRQWEMIMGELPAFLHFVYHFDVPADLRPAGNRMSVRSFHHEDIVEALRGLTSEERLLELISMAPSWPAGGVKVGTAAEIEAWLSQDDVIARKLERILSFTKPMGVILGMIASQERKASRNCADGSYKEKVLTEDGPGKRSVYSIFRDRINP